MRADLIKRREAARDRQDAALARGAAPGDAQVRSELAAVLRELEQIHLETDEASSDPREVARVYSYIADVLFDIGAGSNVDQLGRGLRLYDKALALIGAAEPQRSKVLFNRANTLRGLSHGEDRALLLQSREGFGVALAGFERSAPQLVATARNSLGLVERQLAVLDQLAAARGEQRKIEAKLRGAGGQLMEQARGGGLPGASMQMLLTMIYARYQKDLDAEKIAPERRKILDGIFEELFSLVKRDGAPDETVEEIQARQQKMSVLMLRMNELLANPSAPSIAGPASTRREAVVSELNQARTSLFERVTQRFKPPGETDRAQDLMQKLLLAINDVRNADGDAAVATLERDVLRRLCLEIREFSRRKHLMLVQPIWSVENVVRWTNSIFFSGGGAARARLEAVARVRGLEVVASPVDGMDPADSRWRQLRAANLAVFDYTSESPDLATTSYELGIARALGVDVLILARRTEPVPFDVEVDPVFDDEDLGAAIDRALYRPLGAETGDSVASFLESLKSAAGQPATVEGRYLFRQLNGETSDATRVADLFSQLRGAERLPLLMLQPAWAGRPPSKEPRCFHVTPYTPSWAPQARDAVAEACRSTGVVYVRGDAAGDARIIHSIWNEICQATHVVVDLTGLTSNVMLEAGITHTLGRRCLLVGQTGPDVAKQLIPALAKLRVKPYETGKGIASLRDEVSRFLRT